MIKKEIRLIITFYTTTAAMSMEQTCRNCQINGRLIPVPGTISADCGLAWCAQTEAEASLLEIMEQHGIQYQGIYQCLI